MTEIDYSKYELTAWGKNKDFKKPFEYTTPSGQLVLLQRLDMGDILKLGVADELDFMSKALVADDKSKGDDEGGMTVIAGMAQGENFDRLNRAINTICVSGILAPKVHPVPMVTKTENGKSVTVPNDAARQEGLFYVDAIPFNDRLIMFGEIFETEGLTTFRQEPETGVGNVPDEPSVPLPTE